MRKFALIGMLLLILVLAVPAFGAQSGPGLSKHAEALLAQAEAQNQTTTTLLLVAKPGRAVALATAVAGKGATIRYQDNQLGYIRVIAPVAQAEAISKLADLQALEVNEIVPLPNPEPEGVVGVIPQAVPDANTPKTNPYMPIQDIGGDDFMAAHPTWDGRDVRIGIVDSGVTLDHPSLQTTSTGLRKIIEWVTFTDPLTDGDPTWVQMSADYVKGPSFTWNAVNYTAPGNKKYRIGLFNERVATLGGEVGSDVNRDGNPPSSNGVFPILWDVSKDTVWVDTNQNNNFADDMAMKPYSVNYDVNYFGTDNPATPVAERMPFVVQVNKKDLFVNIGIVSGAHGSHVAGIAAGNALFGGQMSGMAPGAHIVSVRACLFTAGCTNAALIEGMIFAVKSKGVDVVNMSIGGLPSLNDGNNARAILYSRLIDDYDVQIVISAGNSGPGMNTIGDPSVATKVVSVGAYITDDTYLADYGAQLYEDHNLHYFSSRGPREDGGFKPNVVASGAAISTIPMWQAQGCLAQVCPVGYALFNGTSMASPQAAGGVAQLISAAQQAKVQHLPEQIRQALYSTADYLSGRYQVYEQGNGLLDIPAAWALLSAGKMNTVEIESSVPVNTVLSGFLATPGVGVGINDREGVEAGDNYTRTYTFKRTSGPAGAKVYNVSWVDNDGTFSSAGTISLPKNANVSFPVNINPTASGVHSSILNLDDPTNPGIEYQTMN
ncbi:MAG: S8 family serine peptidase, partial [Candidatus Promineofilum sp.]|nr:S8 family serine peptidase [Promineifilum sp.]